MATSEFRLDRLIARGLLLGLALVGAGCNDDHGDEDGHVDEGDHAEPIGPSSGANCPDDASMLTYEDFGKAFMEEYCVRCHSSELTTPEDRSFAPEGHDFDTLEGILLVADHVDQYAAAGPDSNNQTMPPSGARPSKEEREMLGQWLACEQGK